MPSTKNQNKQTKQQKAQNRAVVFKLVWCPSKPQNASCGPYHLAYGSCTKKTPKRFVDRKLQLRKYGIFRGIQIIRSPRESSMSVYFSASIFAESFFENYNLSQQVTLFSITLNFNTFAVTCSSYHLKRDLFHYSVAAELFLEWYV